MFERSLVGTPRKLGISRSTQMLAVRLMTLLNMLDLGIHDVLVHACIGVM